MQARSSKRTIYVISYLFVEFKRIIKEVATDAFCNVVKTKVSKTFVSCWKVNERQLQCVNFQATEATAVCFLSFHKCCVMGLKCFCIYSPFYNFSFTIKKTHFP